MTLGRPELLVLLLLVPLVAVALAAAHRSRSAVLHKLLSHEALAALVPPGALRARAAQALLAVLAALGLTAAAARPQVGFEWVQRKAEGVNIVVVLDVSRSMDAQDVSPSRIERARREIADLVGLLRGDSVGLVLVANGAYLRLPLTTDYGTFLWAVGESATGTIQAQGTSIAAGLDTATQMLTRAGGAGRAILVVSDGEFHDRSTEVDAALARASAADVRVYSLGVGEAAGAPIPLPEGGFKKDRSGEMVLSKLDADQLRHLASATGGAYVQSVVGDDDVRGIYEGEIRAKLKAEERAVKREQIPNERYQWPLGAALLALVGSAWFGIAPREAKPAAAKPAAKGSRAATVATLLLGVLLAHQRHARVGQARGVGPAVALVGDGDREAHAREQRHQRRGDVTGAHDAHRARHRHRLDQHVDAAAAAHAQRRSEVEREHRRRRRVAVEGVERVDHRPQHRALEGAAAHGARAASVGREKELLPRRSGCAPARGDHRRDDRAHPAQQPVGDARVEGRGGDRDGPRERRVVARVVAHLDGVRGPHQPPVARMFTSRAVSSVQPFQRPSGFIAHASVSRSATTVASAPARSSSDTSTPSLVERHGRSMPSLVARRRSQPAQ